MTKDAVKDTEVNEKLSAAFSKHVIEEVGDKLFLMAREHEFKPLTVTAALMAIAAHFAELGLAPWPLDVRDQVLQDFVSDIKKSLTKSVGSVGGIQQWNCD